MWQYNGNQRPEFAIEPGPGQESVWDYPRPPMCVPENRRVVVQVGERVIADSKAAVRVLETASPPTIYLPPTDVDFAYLKQSSGRSFCEWKGQATYWSLLAPQESVSQIGWSYESPSPRFAELKSFLSFYPRKSECYLGDERVRPQSGGFYGGWVTDEIVGPYKGEPGTSGW